MSLRRRASSLFNSFRSCIAPHNARVEDILTKDAIPTVHDGPIEDTKPSQPPTPAQQGPSALLDFPEEILFAILSQSSCISLINLSATCKALRSAIDNKTVWLDALENMTRRRPVPLSYRNMVSRGTTAELPLNDVRTAVTRAAKLEKRWSQDIIKPTSYQLIAVLPSDDHLIWAWSLDVGRYLMTYSALGWFTCTILETGKIVKFKTTYDCCCWDFDLDTEGITIVFNVDWGETQPCIQVYRINLADATWQLMNTTAAMGHVRSNFLEDDIAGCVLSPSEGSTLIIQVVNWRTGQCAIIDSKVQCGMNLSASTTKKALLFCSTSMYLVDSWTYDFSFLKTCVAMAESVEKPYRVDALPQYHFRTQYVDQGIITSGRRVPWSMVPTTRGMWTKRQCMLTFIPSRPDGGSSILYALLADENSCATMEESPTALSSTDTSTMKSFKTVSRRTFIYSPPMETMLTIGLYAMGHSGKHAAWIETTGDGRVECRLASFDCFDDAEEGPAITTYSTIELEEGCGLKWAEVSRIELDDNAGIMTCAVRGDVWNLYFGD